MTQLSSVQRIVIHAFCIVTARRKSSSSLNCCPESQEIRRALKNRHSMSEQRNAPVTISCAKMLPGESIDCHWPILRRNSHLPATTNIESADSQVVFDPVASASIWSLHRIPAFHADTFSVEVRSIVDPSIFIENLSREFHRIRRCLVEGQSSCPR